MDASLPSADRQYADLVRQVLSRGVRRPDRTGGGTWALHGAMMRLDLSEGRLPLLTTKRVAWKTAAKETLWFLSGDRRLRTLLVQNVRIWSDWPHARHVRKTGDAMGLADFEAKILADDAFDARWGDLGPLRREGGRDRPDLPDPRAPPPRPLLTPPPLARLEPGAARRDGPAALPPAQPALRRPGPLLAHALPALLLRRPRPALQSRRRLASPAPDIFSYTPDHVRVEGYDPHPAVPLPVAV